MASWRAPGSILEAPGLDFGGSWVDFSEIFSKKTINVKNLPRKDIDHRFARPPKVGGRRWSPPGGFNPPPTEGVQGVLDHQPHRFQIRSTHHSSRIWKAKLIMQA